jgi:hypothetical protein
MQTQKPIQKTDNEYITIFKPRTNSKRIKIRIPYSMIPDCALELRHEVLFASAKQRNRAFHERGIVEELWGEKEM